MDGSLESRTGRAGTGRSLLAALICSALISVAAYSGAAAAQEADACAFLIDFGNGRAQWVDVPVTKGMTGFHVFENATRTLGLSETHAYEAPWGNTIMSIDGYAGNYNFSNPQQPYDFWRLWVWDSNTKEWRYSATLLDGIDPIATKAIAAIYARDPYIGPPAATPEYRDPWISERGDFANTGSDLSYEPSGIVQKWQKDLGNGAVDAPIVSSGGRIFAVTSGIASSGSYTTDSKLFCLDPSGEVLWSAPVGRGHQTASPLLWDYTVYVASDDGKLYAFDQETGSELWTYTVTSGGISASPLTFRNLLIVTADDGTITAVTAKGARAWSRSIGTTASATPALFDVTLYVPGGDGSLYAVAGDGSKVEWSVKVGGALNAPVAMNDRLIVTYSDPAGTGSGGGAASISYDGSIVWKATTASNAGQAAVSKQGAVSISSQGLSMLSLDGSVRWTASYGSETPGGSPVTVNGMTYLVTNETNSRVVAISDDGNVEWTEPIEPGANVRASPSISDGMLYLGSTSGSVIASLLEGEGRSMPPVGLFTFTASGTTAHFDASSSYGGNGTLSFHWEFDDGQTAAGAKVDHTFAVGGNHTVTLTVTDAAGTSRSLTKTIDLDDPGAQGGSGTGESGGVPVMVMAGLAVVVLLGSMALYIRWVRRKG